MLVIIGKKRLIILNAICYNSIKLGRRLNGSDVTASIYVDTIPLNTFLINYNCVYECALIGFNVFDCSVI